MKLSTFEAFKNINDAKGTFITLEGALLRKFQLVVLSIAEDVIGLCESEGIHYQLGGGSALGAIRHGGFIPWDDDMDINIMGYQREQFMKSFKSKFGNKYWINSYEKDNYGKDMCQIRLKGTVCRTRDDIGNDECGIYVDVFFLENVYDNPIKRRLHGYLCLFMGLMLSCRNFYRNKQLMNEIAESNPELKRVFRIKLAMGRMISFMSLRTWSVLTHRCYTMCKDSNSKYVSFPAGRKHYFGEMYLREGMENTIEGNFEGHSWRVPIDYDSYFKVLYGDNYMTIPPKERREKHLLLELKFPENADNTLD